MKTYLSYFSQLLWISAIMIELFTPLPVWANLPGAISQASQQISNTLQQQQQQRQLLALQQSMQPITGQDQTKLLCPVLMDNPAAANPPLCSPQAPHMAAPLAALYQKNAFLFDQHKQTTVTCLEDKQKILKSKLSEHEQNLETFLAHAKKITEQERQGIKGGREEINRLDTLLRGGDQDLDYSVSLQGTSCQQTLPTGSVRQQGSRGGLLAIREILEGIKDRATEVKKIDFEKIFHTEILELEKEFQTTGFSATQNSPSQNNVHQSYQKLKLEARQKIDQIQEEINRYLPALSGGAAAPSPDDGQYAKKLESFAQPQNWRERFLQQCLNGQFNGSYARGGLAFLQQRLRRRNSSNKHNPQDGYIKSYSNFIQDLYQAPGSIRGKRAKLIAFDKKMRSKTNIPVTIISRNGPMADIPTFFDNEVRGCQNNFAHLPLVPLPGGDTISYQEAQNRAIEAMGRAKQTHDQFKNNFRNNLRARVLNCQDIPYNSSPSGKEQCLNQDSPTFCRSHAIRCAQSVSSCYNGLDRQIKQIKNQKYATTDAVNRQMKLYRHKINSTMDQVLNQAKSWNQLLRQSYPALKVLALDEKSFSIEEEIPTIREKLIADGNPNSFLEELEGAIGKLKSAFQTQRDDISTLITEEKDKIAQSYDQAKKKWENLAKTCEGIVGNYQKTMEKQYEQYQKDTQSVAEICQKVRNNQALNCEDESIGRILTPLNAIDPTTYDRICQGDPDDEESEETVSEGNMREMCKVNEITYDSPSSSPMTQEDDYASYGIDFQDNSLLTTNNIESYLNNPQQIQGLLRNGNSLFIRTQVAILQLLADGKQNEGWIKECNSIRQSISNTLQEKQQDYDQCQERSAASSSGDRIPTLNECSRADRDEITSTAIRTGIKDDIETLIEAQKTAKRLKRSSGLYGEIRLPLCQGQSQANRSSNPLDRPPLAPPAHGPGPVRGGTLPHGPGTYPR